MSTKNQFIMVMPVCVSISLSIVWAYAMISTNGSGAACINCMNEGWIETGVFGVIGFLGLKEWLKLIQ